MSLPVFTQAELIRFQFIVDPSRDPALPPFTPYFVADTEQYARLPEEVKALYESEADVEGFYVAIWLSASWKQPVAA